MAQSALNVFDVTQQAGANDRERIQNAIDDAGAAGGGTVYFPAGAYTVTATTAGTEIELASDVALELAPGAKVDFSASSVNRIAFKAEGTESAPVSLTASASEGDTFVTIASAALSGFPRGSLVRIGSTRQYDPNEDHQPIGELNYVDVPRLTAAVTSAATTLEVDNTDSLPSTGTVLVDSEQMTYSKPGGVSGIVSLTVSRGANGTTAASHTAGAAIALLPLGRLLLRMPLQGGPYAVSDSAVISAITPMRNVSVSGGLMVGGGAGSNHIGVRLDRTAHSRVVETALEGFDGMAIVLNDSVDALVDSISVDNTRRQTTQGTASGYGVGLTYANQDCTIRNSFFRRCRHATSVGAATDRMGVPRRIAFIGNRINDTTGTAMDLHAPCTPSMLFSGNLIYGCLGAFNVYNNGAVIANNIVTRCKSGVNFGNKTAYPTELTVSGNTFTECSDYGIIVGSAPEGVDAIRHILVADNRVFRPESWGIYLFSNEDWDISRASLTGNLITAGATTDGGIRIVKATGCVVSSNNVSDMPANAPGIKLEGAAKCVIASSHVGYATTGSGKAIQVIDGEDLSITGNVIRGAGTGISVESSSPPGAVSGACVLIGNNVRGCTTPLSLAGLDHIAKATDTPTEAFNRE